MKQQRSPWMWALIVCATVAVYWPALRGTLLWDDTSHVTRAGLRLSQIWFHLGATQQYYPLLHSAFWVEHQLWGNSVLGYHLVNVLLHALSACLVVLIVRRLGLPGAWIAGLLFALHPVCVESVAWISEQKSTLSGVFYLASALVYLQFDESRKRSRYWLALAFFLLALMSKTVTATLPAALLVVFWWQRGQLDWKRDVLPLVPWLALGASAGLFTAWVERTYIGAQGAGFSLSLAQRVMLAGQLLWFYAVKLVLPLNLTFFYPRWNVDPGQWWQYLFAAAVLALAIVLRRRRGALASLLIFTGTLFPVLGFFNVYPFRYSWAADHFQYLAMLAVLVPAAAWLARRHIAITAVVVAVLGAATFAQSGTYRDSETLYRATIARNPHSWLAHNNLGNSLLEDPARRDEAVAQFQEALRAKPDYADAHLSLGNALAQDPQRINEAIAEYQTALRIEPNSERAHNNLASVLTQTGRLNEAVAEAQAALRIQPAYAEAHNNLGNALSLMPGRLNEAIAEYQAAIRNEPNLPEAHNNLGRCLAQVPGRMADAVAEFQAAIRLRPNYWSAHNNLGNALATIPGRLGDAIAEYQEAIQLQPNSPNSHYNLGNAFVQMGRLADAAAEYQATLRLQPASADAHFRLAGVYANMPGRTADAIAELEMVMRLRPSAEVQSILAGLKKRR